MVHGPVIDPELCTGCNRCVEKCPANILFPSNIPGGPPIVEYPEECHYHHVCVEVCPVKPSAIRLVHPLDMRLALKRVKQ